MIQSMTGYGKAVVAFKDKKISAEIKSLNSKQLDLQTRIAPLYREKEMEIRQMIAAALERGKVEFALWIEKDAGVDATPVNAALVENYYHQLKAVAEKVGIPEPEDWMYTLTRMPDVLTKTDQEVLSDEEWEAARQAVAQAIQALVDFRKQEGAALEKKFAEKIDNIERLLAEIEPYEKSRVEKIRQRIVDGLQQIPGVEWIRLHYAYPTDFPEELLDVMAKHPNVCKYLDIALQHCTDHMLGLMRRHISRAEQDALIKRIREKVPGICIRTTLLVGHPGETEADFEELKKWVKEMRFERMGCFAYSDEEGTYANTHYKDDIPQEVKEARASELMAIQQEISAEIMAQFIGTTQKVIIDRIDGEFAIGRTQYDSPEVDCEVLVENIDNRSLVIGNFYDVEITKAEEFDLYGKIKD